MPNPLKDLKLSLEELKVIAKIRGIKGHKSMSEDEILSAFSLSRYKFSKLKTKKIRVNIYEMKNEKHLSESKIKEIEKNLTKLDENLFKTKKYYNYYDIEYKGIRNVRDLLDLPIDEGYYKPVIARGAFNSSYIQYESKGDKGKNLNMLIS